MQLKIPWKEGPDCCRIAERMGRSGGASTDIPEPHMDMETFRNVTEGGERKKGGAPGPGAQK